MNRTVTRPDTIDVGPKQPTDLIRAGGAACLLGGLVAAGGAIEIQVVQASTTVPDDVWHYPLTADTAVLAWSVLGVLWTFILAGVFAWRRSGSAGSSRAARIGVPLAATGVLLIVVGHVASIPIRNQTMDEAGAQFVGGIFGVGSVLSAAGLLIAGVATLRAGVWQDWRRFVPLCVGIVAVATIGLQFTKALPTAIALFSLAFAGLGDALLRGPRRS